MQLTSPQGTISVTNKEESWSISVGALIGIGHIELYSTRSQNGTLLTVCPTISTFTIQV